MKLASTAGREVSKRLIPRKEPERVVVASRRWFQGILHVTPCDAMQREMTPVNVDGRLYYPAIQICRALGISRQTLWRWRQDGKVPTGRRYRDQQILFTEGELDTIIEYANRLQPLNAPAGQMSISFGRKDRKS